MTTQTTTEQTTNNENALPVLFGKEKDNLEDLTPEEMIELTERLNKENQDIGFLNNTFLGLFMSEPFLGAVSMAVSKIATHKMPTAYIGARPNGRSLEVVMGFNPLFMKAQNQEQQKGVIVHELYHMIFQHIFTRSMGNRANDQLWNIATDLAINSIIGKASLPEVCLIPGIRPKTDPNTSNQLSEKIADFIEKAPQKAASDYYYEELRKIRDENQDGGDGSDIVIGFGTMDDHGHWNELPDDVQEQIRDKVREMLGKAAENALKNNSWGSVPQEIQEIIKKILSKEVDWRSIIRNFIGRTRTTERNSTIRRINKKMPYIQPGVKRPTRANFVCFVDQSASVSDEEIGLFFGELESLASLTAIDVYHFDTEIDMKSHTVWKKGSPCPKPHRTRCGGTDFSAAAEFLNKRENKGKWSGAVILSDGYADKMPEVYGTKVMWVLTENSTVEALRPGQLYCRMKKDKKFQSY